MQVLNFVNAQLGLKHVHARSKYCQDYHTCRKSQPADGRKPRFTIMFFVNDDFLPILTFFARQPSILPEYSIVEPNNNDPFIRHGLCCI